jgi:hypothetical protein
MTFAGSTGDQNKTTELCFKLYGRACGSESAVTL